MRPLLYAAALALVTQPAFSQETETTDPVIRPVRLLTVNAGNAGITRQFFGQVVARQTVDLAFQVGGQIVQLPVSEGQEIVAGALIAELDLETFQLQRDQAQVQLDQATRNWERMQALTGGSVSQVTVDDAETAYDLAQIGLRNAEYALENATLTAPFDALVATRNVANFTTIGAGSPVVRLHDMSELRIDIDVPEILFQQAGREADVTLYAQFPVSDETYPLMVREFNAEASNVGQTFRLTLAMERPDSRAVLPGTSVTVYATINPENAPIVIPAAAIYAGNDGSVYAMRFVPGEGDMGQIERVALEIEPTREGLFSVLSGLEHGDEIVSAGVAQLSDGMQVRRFSGFSN